MVISARETRNLLSILGAEAHSANAATNWLGERAGGTAIRFIGG